MGSARARVGADHGVAVVTWQTAMLLCGLSAGYWVGVGAFWCVILRALSRRDMSGAGPWLALVFGPALWPVTAMLFVGAALHKSLSEPRAPRLPEARVVPARGDRCAMPMFHEACLQRGEHCGRCGGQS